MNYEQFTDFAGDIVLSQGENEDSFYPAARVADAFGTAVSKFRTRLRAGERQFSENGHETSELLVTGSGLCKLAFAGNSPEAEAFRVWVAGEVVPLLLINGGYSGLAIHADDQARAAREQGSLLALRVAASAYAALGGNAPEDRDFQDYLAEVVMPAILEDGVFAASPDDDLRTCAFEALAALR